ncbi:hypothetical protein IM538_07295 [Cytobacillus suaedae]|nr:hypothetical protein IM538_07295 [Cytobacillus suaedae]
MDIDFNAITDNMPNFENHDDAKAWFEEYFEDKFVFKNQDELNGKTVYYYHIVKNPDAYSQYMVSLTSEVKPHITDFNTVKSYSTVEISEDGEVSFTQ